MIGWLLNGASATLGVVLAFTIWRGTGRWLPTLSGVVVPLSLPALGLFTGGAIFVAIYGRDEAVVQPDSFLLAEAFAAFPLVAGWLIRVWRQ